MKRVHPSRQYNISVSSTPSTTDTPLLAALPAVVESLVEEVVIRTEEDKAWIEQLSWAYDGDGDGLAGEGETAAVSKPVDQTLAVRPDTDGAWQHFRAKGSVTGEVNTDEADSRTPLFFAVETDDYGDAALEEPEGEHTTGMPEQTESEKKQEEASRFPTNSIYSSLARTRDNVILYGIMCHSYLISCGNLCKMGRRL